jgi:hypothetical protein
MSEANELYMEEIDQAADEIQEEALEYNDSPVDTDRFVIDDDGKANWAIQKIKEAQAEIENWRDYYQSNLEKITKRQNARIEYLKFLLSNYFRTVPHHKTKTQDSYSLPSGQLLLKRPNPKYKTDDEKLVPWLKENGLTDLIKTETVEKAMWGELKKKVTVEGTSVISEDGEIIPGIEVLLQPPTFEVK